MNRLFRLVSVPRLAWAAPLVLVLAGCGLFPSTTGEIKGKLQPAFDLQPAPAVAVPAGATFRPGEAIVKFRSAAGRAQALSAGGLNAVSSLGPRTSLVRRGGAAFTPLAVSGASGVDTLRWIAGLRARPDVAFAEPNFILKPALVSPNDTYFRSQSQWNLAMSKFPAAWNVNVSGTPLADLTGNVIVAVVDTGVLVNHPDFQCDVPTSAGSKPKIVPGYDFVDDDTNPTDPGPEVSTEYHGTHVAGIIGACTNNALGVAGAAYNARILPVRVLGKDGGTTETVIKGMRWAAGIDVGGSAGVNPNPAKVINLSLGAPGGFDQSMQDAIDEVNATGAVVVVAAGNDNVDAGGYTPASQNRVIAVGAAAPGASVDVARAGYSNYGATLALIAPGGDAAGHDVVSTLGSDQGSAVQYVYGGLSGTSMAAPHVSAAAALMLAAQPSLLNPATPDEAGKVWARLLAVLRRTVDASHPVSGIENCLLGCGAGLLDANGAAQAAASGNTSIGALLSDPNGNLNFGEYPGGPTTQTATVTLHNDGDATGAWTVTASGGALTPASSDFSLNAGASGTLSVTLDWSKVGSGAFVATLTFTPVGGGVPFTVPVGYQKGVNANAGSLYVRYYRHDASHANGRVRVNCPGQKVDPPYDFQSSLQLAPGVYDLAAYRPTGTNPDGTVIVDQLMEIDDLTVEAGKVTNAGTVALSSTTQTIGSEASGSCQ